MEDRPCCDGGALPEGTCVETPCGDSLWPPCQTGPGGAAPASSDPCLPVYRVGAESMTLCVHPASDACPVSVHRTTGWLTYAYCIPPRPALG